MEKRLILAIGGVVLAMSVISVRATPILGPPDWVNQTIDSGFSLRPRVLLVEATVPQTFEQISKDIGNLNLVASENFGTMKRANDDALPKKKEQKVWDGELKTVAGNIKVLAKDEADNNAKMLPLNVKIRQWNADCAGHPITNAQDAVCGDRMRLLQRQKTPLDQRKVQLETQSIQYLQRFEKIKARWQELESELTRLKNIFDAARAKFDHARQQIVQLQAIAKDRCDKKRTPEDMVYCGELEWDGAKRGLPPLSDSPPVFMQMR